MTRLIQIKKGNVRRVAVVKEPNARLRLGGSSIYELAQIAIYAGKKLSEAARERAQADTLDYELIYTGRSEWRLLPAIDHPEESACCHVSGSGLTHIGSARVQRSGPVAGWRRDASGCRRIRTSIDESRSIGQIQTRAYSY
jgi:hypothetical protein